VTRFARRSDTGLEQGSTSLELFYDLVFVFAVTQVSHLLLDDLTWRGAGHATLALLVVWWAWNYTTWVTNELDPQSTVVRLLLIALTLLSLLLAVAIPDAFGERALLFAGSYVGIQVGRHTFLAFATAERGSLERERALRILIWFAGAGVFWLAGAFADGRARGLLWLVALAIDYGAPSVLYRVPGRARLTHETWQIETSHFAERFQLFMIIALGETIVLTGATTAKLDLDLAILTAFALAFVSTAALWWLYFDYVARIAEHRLAAADDRTRLARDGYTYLHAVLVGGVILSAVGDEIVIAHATERLHTSELVVVAAGPALYLVGHVLFRLRMAGSLSWKRLLGAADCVVVGLVGAVVPALVVVALLVCVLAAVIAAERFATARRRARGEPSPLERLEASASSG
jgi:low temperature requirement protein LtrA